eukprot:7433436-Ditylum_brightwellii.AAC.1
MIDVNGSNATKQGVLLKGTTNVSRETNNSAIASLKAEISELKNEKEHTIAQLNAINKEENQNDQQVVNKLKADIDAVMDGIQQLKENERSKVHALQNLEMKAKEREQ